MDGKIYEKFSVTPELYMVSAMIYENRINSNYKILFSYV